MTNHPFLSLFEARWQKPQHPHQWVPTQSSCALPRRLHLDVQSVPIVWFFYLIRLSMHFKTLQTVSIYILMRKWTKHGWHRTRTYVAHKDTQYLEIQQSVQLVLDDGQRLDQLLCVHGAHHAVNTDKTGNKNAHKHTITAGTLWTKFKFWCKLRGFTKKEWSDDP